MTTAVSNVSLTSAPSPPVVNGSLNSTNTYYFGFVGKFSTNTRSTFEAQAKRQSPKARELLLVLETLSGRTIATHQKNAAVRNDRGQTTPSSRGIPAFRPKQVNRLL